MVGPKLPLEEHLAVCLGVRLTTADHARLLDYAARLELSPSQTVRTIVHQVLRAEELGRVPVPPALAAEVVRAIE